MYMCECLYEGLCLMLGVFPNHSLAHSLRHGLTEARALRHGLLKRTISLWDSPVSLEIYTGILKGPSCPFGFKQILAPRLQSTLLYDKCVIH